METVISIDEYRKILGDSISSDEKIVQRLQYLEGFCRNIIRKELKKCQKISKK